MFNVPQIHRVALLIDADNVQLRYIKHILNIAKCYGSLTICRAYGDWKQPPLYSWHKKMIDPDIMLVQQDRIVDNATDYRLMIEAGEIMGADDADVFIIASGDVHFTSLCGRIKEKGKQVIGIGNEENSSLTLQEICNDFLFIEELETKIRLKDLELLVITAIHQLPQKDGYVHCGQLGKKLYEIEPNYKSKFGSKKLSKLLKTHPHIFKIQQNYVSLV